MRKITAIVWVFMTVCFFTASVYAQTPTPITRGNQSSSLGGGPAGGGPFSSISWSHTLGINSDLLTVGIYESVSGGAPAPITSVMYGTQSMTLAVSANNTFIYYLVNPASGTNTITVTLSGTASEFVVVAQDYTGVDTVNPIDATTFQSTDVSPLTLTVTTTKDKDWAFMFVRDGSGTENPGTNSTVIFQSNANNPPNLGAGAYDNQAFGAITPAGSFSMTVTNGSGSPSMHGIMIVFSPLPNPSPTTTNIAPTSAMAGSAGLTLTVNGTNFISSSVVRFNGSDKSTTFISSTQLTAQILTSDLTAAGTFPITVFNPSPGGGTSNPQTFMVTPNPLDNLDVPLSTRNAEATQLLIKSNTDTLLARTPKPWQFYTDSGKGFSIVIDGLILTNINKTDVLLIKNPIASGIITRLKRLYASPDRDFVNIEIYRNPTITSNGTSIIPFNYKVSGGPATTQLFQSPAISSRGTLVFTGKLGAFLKSIDFELARFLEAGENILIVLQADRANIEVDLTLDFAEE